MELKIDLIKDYDKFNWNYFRLMLVNLRFRGEFLTWVMNDVSTISFDILNDGSTTSFCKKGRGLQQGCLVSPLLLLILIEGLSKDLMTTKRIESLISE